MISRIAADLVLIFSLANPPKPFRIFHVFFTYFLQPLHVLQDKPGTTMNEPV